MRRRLVAIACGATLGAAAIAAGCGGSESVDAEAVTASSIPATIPAPATAPAAETTMPESSPATETTVTPSEDLADLLRPVLGLHWRLKPVPVKRITDAAEMANLLYRIAGADAKAAARTRLEAAGFVEAAVRDHYSGDGEPVPWHFRTVVLRVGDEDHARAEAQRVVQGVIDRDGFDQIRPESKLEYTRVPVAVSDHAHGVRGNSTDRFIRHSVEVLAIPRGPLLYILVAQAPRPTELLSDELHEAARALHDQPQPQP